MSHLSYEALRHRWNLKRAIKFAIIFVLVCTFVISPALWIWNQSVQKRQILREAKNVLLNMELLSLEYFGFGNQLQDSGRDSGLSAEAEKEIRSFSGADGNIHLISWNHAEHCVSSMSYQKEHYLMHYHYDSAEEKGVWEVYWKLHEYET